MGGVNFRSNFAKFSGRVVPALSFILFAFLFSLAGTAHAGGGKLPKLAVVKTCTQDPKPGDIIHCDIVISNNTKEDYWEVRVHDVVPPHLTYIQEGSSPECKNARCSFNPLKKYTTKTVWMKFRLSEKAPCGKQIVNQVDVTAKHAETNWGKAMFTPSCGSGQVDVVKTGPASATPGETISYTITATNNTGRKVTGVQVIDSFSGGLTYVAAGSTAGCVESGSAVRCAGSDYAPGQSKSFTLLFRVPDNAGCNLKIVNQASLHCPNAPSGTSKVTTKVACAPTPKPQCSDGIDNDGDGKVDYPADPGCDGPDDNDESNPVLSITKTGASTTSPGGEIDYTITVTNSGTAAATGVNVTDPVPAQLEYVQAGSSTECSLQAGPAVHCSGFDIPAGGSRSLVVKFKVLPTCGCNVQIINRAEVRASNAPKAAGCQHVATVVCKPQCSDGIDNDGDGKVDYPADPGCDGPDDNDEKDPPAPPVLPYLECVYELGHGKYRAYFGYDNTGGQPVQIAAGTDGAGAVNAFSSDPKDRGQISSFAPGRHTAAFSVIFDGKPIEWRIKPENGVLNKITASKTSKICPCIEPAAECVDRKQNGEATAKFGYKNKNPFEIKIDIGEANRFTPAPEDRGQPNGFFSGNIASAFSVTYSGADIKWLLGTHTAAVTKHLPRCTPNKPPKCNAGSPYAVQCQGAQSKVFLDGSSSSDEDGQPLTYAWTTTCGALSDASLAQPVLTIDSSGGAVITCKASLTVSDGVESSTCEQTVEVTACAKDCAGQVGGSAQVDQCGVCGGDGTSCLDCAGVPNGNAKVDKCGVCGGNDACVDCAGEVNGSAKPDRCGVCNGDGNSCIGCSSSDITNLLFALDSGALAQRNLVRNAAKRLKRLNAGAATNKIATDAEKEAEVRYVEAWNEAWKIPRIVNNCTNATICTESDNGIYVSAYNTHSASLRDLALRLAREFKNLQRKGVRGIPENEVKRLSQRANKLHEANLTTSASVPRFNSICN